MSKTATEQLPAVHPKQQLLPGALPEADALKRENERLRNALAEAVACVAWYGTPSNWHRRLDGKDRDLPAPAYDKRSDPGQDCLRRMEAILAPPCDDDSPETRVIAEVVSKHVIR